MKQELKNFVPEKQIRIDAEHSLEQISGRFQNIKDGLPELIKNSKDHYSRLGVKKKEERQIVVIVSEDRTSLAVLDFAGAAAEDFEGWKTWSSRTANQKELAEDIEGGYGNGGKSFMVRGCKIKSSMCGYRDGKINKWGFINTEPSLKFKAGTFKDEYGKELKNLSNANYETVLNKELSAVGLNIASLPKQCQEALEKRKAFTFVLLEGVRSWESLNALNLSRAIHHLPSYLMENAQASLTIETCTVWVILEGKILPEPLTVIDLFPFEGLENIEPIAIPDVLEDPETGEKVKLNLKDKDKNFLQIKTSKQNLRLSDRLKPRNVIRVRNTRNIVANWLLSDLVQLTSSPFLYGSITCELLDNSEHLAGSERQNLAENPLTRALKHWTSEKLTEIGKEILRVQASKNTEEDVDTAAETLKKLRDLMKEFLVDRNNDGSEGEGDERDKGDKKKKKKGERRKSVKIDEIVLETVGKDINVPEGSIVPLIVKCFEHREGERFRVKNPHLVLCVDNEIIEWVDDCYIKVIREGEADLFFETPDKRLQSNSIKVRGVKVDKLNVKPIEKILKQGESVQIEVEALDAKGQKIEEIIFESHVDEIEMGKITRNCMFTAGGLEGSATVKIRWGPKDDQVYILKIKIGNEKIEEKGDSGDSGIPYILLCGKEAPGREDLPMESRTLQGGEDYPTIVDYDPLWEGIIWLNQHSAESKKMRTRGEGGTIKISSRTFQQFLALKCFEILKRLKVEESFRDGGRTMIEFKLALANAEMETAGFLEKAYALVRELIKGEEDED